MSKTALPVLGPCQVWYKGTELGKTHGGVHFICEEVAAEIGYDQVGVTPWDKVITGKTARVEADFANLSHALLDLLINGSTIYTGGATPGCEQALDILCGVGTTYRANGGILILKPYVNGVVSPDSCDWITVPLAYARVEMDLVFDAETQRVVHAIFDALPVSQNTPRLWFMGESGVLPA